MLRNILAVIAAFIVGGILVTLFETCGHMIYPVPAGLDPMKPETITEYLKTAPIGAILAVLVAQCAGSFGGGMVTGLISIAKNPTALIYGILALIMAGLNAFMFPHPLWFIVLSLILQIPLSFAGSRVAQMFVKT